MIMYRFKLILYCFFLAIFSATTITADGNFEDAELVNEFITMSFSSSHPYDLRHTIPGEPDIDYPIYSAVPKTNFDCDGRHEGYYADIETRCQVFRICTNTDVIGRGFAFLCPNGTLFSQKNFVCDWYRNVDCSDSERYYSKNDGNRIGTKTEIMETVRHMMEHPMKTITIALNRSKPTTSQPITYQRSAFTTTRNPTSIQTTFAPTRNIPTQQSIIPRRQPVTFNEVESVSGLLPPPPKQENLLNRGQNRLQDSSPNEKAKTVEESYTTLDTPTNRFAASTEIPSPALEFSPPLPSTNEAPLGSTVPSRTGTPSFTTETTKDEKEVYVSSLGELSTDPGVSFDRQTARIIAEPTSSSITVQRISTRKSVSGSPDKMNFAEKVNAGLNGLQVGNRNEIIAPEYVQNILHTNVAGSQKTIQPPSYDFASNVNSLLDEVAYESELEGQNSVQVQLRTPSEGVAGSTRKPFRFLSRGFSYENTKQDGSYVYGPTPGLRNTLPRMQVSTSTESYSNSFLTTPFFINPAPVTSTEAAHNFDFVNPSAQPSIKSISTPPEFSGRTANELTQKDDLVKIQSGTKINLDDASPKDEPNLRLGTNLKSELDFQSTTRTEDKEGIEVTTEGIFSTLTDLPGEPENGEKENANKRAEKLLLAGVKQTILDNLSDHSNNDNIKEDTPIVPLYTRVTELQTTPSPTITPVSTLLLITTSKPVSTTTPATITTPSPPITSTHSIRRYTVNNIHRRQATRPVYTKRQNVVRSARRSNTATTTPSPAENIASSLRTTSTTRPTASIRRRPTVSQYSFGSRRRSISSTTPISTTSTTIISNKKIAVRSSDKDVSDLTAVASTYNAAPKRDYNSIRQSSYKYVQTQRRRPNPKTTGSGATTTSTRPTTTTSTTQQPSRSSSLPIPTLAPFSQEALSPLTTTSTTPASLPATYLSFNDLTKSIIDDSILQTFRRNQDNFGSTLRPPTPRRPPQTPPIRQQLPAFVTTKRPTIKPASRAPLVPLKEFIASKFGANYSPAPPILSTLRPIQPTLAPLRNNDRAGKVQSAYAPQYQKQQYSARQDYTPQTVVPINPAPAVHHAVPKTLPPIIPHNVAQQQPQFIVQHPQQAPQQNYFQLHQQQPIVQPVQQFVQFQHQGSTGFPTLPQQVVQRGFSNHQQLPQRNIIQQGQQILQRTIYPAQQQQTFSQLQQFQRSQSEQQRSFPAQQPQAQSQIQIFPSQVTAVQTIPPNVNIGPEVGSVNVHLPTHLSGLIPNTNLFDTRLSSESLARAQKRIDHPEEETDGGPESVSAYMGVTSYDVPLSSIGRLANDITHLLRKVRRL